ncbi:segregation/condensation protein A [Pseudoalteromonas sp. NBT06-2]|uniref:segregation and condensation protein A n=1 Tax=Pseudoalteromonas sp. NBT06-2 TaxID=2025950 RepID=UPI000BA7B563|nr:ScpA family protein [Pseudoalteromonas sp. NBT06-2]PAJ73944.1 segregation/condensation protein A [Pseudoalteromonas sp. NBT06-2]
MVEKPTDLYIPPDALEVILETFEGPLDLLLYLIKKHQLDILQLSVHTITRQYVAYVELMKDLKLELAAEYLVMAALLTQIKSRLLLPVHKELEEQEVDPRVELIKRLQEYEQFKTAAENLDEIPRLDRDIFVAQALISEKIVPETLLPDVDMKDILLSLGDIMARAKNYTHHHISAETLSTREQMSKILQQLSETTEFVEFSLLFELSEGRNGVVVTFIAILELIKECLIECIQSEPRIQIYVQLIR